MNSKWLRLLVCTLVVVFPAHASFITIETGFMVTETGNGPVFLVSTINRGDEPAYDVQLEVTAHSQQYTAPLARKIGIGKKLESEFRIGEVFELPGHYPIVIKTHYKDANGYPFSALTAGYYDSGEPVSSKILMRANPLAIPANGKGWLEYVVRNTDSEARKVSLKLYLPDELVAAKDDAALDLQPNSAEIVTFEVENFSALANSRYSVLMIASYEARGRHYGSVGSTQIRISEPGLLPDLAWLIPWLIAGVILLILFLLVTKHRKAGP